MEKIELFKQKSYKKILISNYGTLFDLLFYKNKQQVACTGNDHDISFWDLKTYQKTLILKGHINTVTSFQQCHENQNLFVSTSSDKTVKVWKLKSDLTQEQIQQNIKDKKDNLNYDIIVDFKNPDNKTTIGATFINENVFVFGQCTNKAYFYNIKENKIDHIYQFPIQQEKQDINNNNNEIDDKTTNIITNEKTIFKNYINNENSAKQKDFQKPKQSWVTYLHYDKTLDLLILCENSKLHFVNPKSYEIINIINNTHQGHILSLKIHENLLLIGSSDTYTYLYEISYTERKTLNLIQKLKIKAWTSACTNVDFYLEKGQINKKVGGIIISTFDPVVKFVNLQGEIIYQVDNVASPMIWDSESYTLVARDYNITRELVIQQFEK